MFCKGFTQAPHLNNPQLYSVDYRSVRRENLQLVIREIDTSIGHKSENVIVT